MNQRDHNSDVQLPLMGARISTECAERNKGLE
jgi:hypothetical protein